MQGSTRRTPRDERDDTMMITNETVRWRMVVPRQYELVDRVSGEVLGQVYGIVGSCNRLTGSWRHSRSERRFRSCKSAAAALVQSLQN
jgi:hypothetical protein